MTTHGATEDVEQALRSLRTRSDNFMPLLDAARLLGHFQAQDPFAGFAPNIAAGANLLQALAWLSAELGPLEEREFVQDGKTCRETVGPIDSEHYRRADDHCSVATLWAAARKKGMLDALKVFTSIEAERKALGLQHFEDQRADGDAVAPTAAPMVGPLAHPEETNPVKHRQLVLQKRRELDAVGHRAPTKQLARELGISDRRVRQLISEAEPSKPKAPKPRKKRNPAQPFDALLKRGR